ncbi:MAG TPA: hypothetical protein VGF16_03175 [Bryobacteraceae bacterium]
MQLRHWALALALATGLAGVSEAKKGVVYPGVGKKVKHMKPGRPKVPRTRVPKAKPGKRPKVKGH